MQALTRNLRLSVAELSRKTGFKNLHFTLPAFYSVIQCLSYLLCMRFDPLLLSGSSVCPNGQHHHRSQPRETARPGLPTLTSGCEFHTTDTPNPKVWQRSF